MKKIVLDTNAYARLMTGDEQVLAILSESEIVYMSVFVLGELYAGFKGGGRERENTALLKRFLKKPTVDVLEATEETSELFGRVKSNLKRAGTPLPINDVWIAAHAFEVGAVLVTFDSHFNHIADLRTWRDI
jgi:tRNA(fMet)-specific endonuclease VapC